MIMFGGATDGNQEKNCWCQYGDFKKAISKDQDLA